MFIDCGNWELATNFFVLVTTRFTVTKWHYFGLLLIVFGQPYLFSHRLTPYWCDAGVHLHPNAFNTLWWMHRHHENHGWVIFCILLFDMKMHKCLEQILMGAMWKLESKWNILSLWHSTTFTWEMGLVWNLKMCWKFFECWC